MKTIESHICFDDNNIKKTTSRLHEHGLVVGFAHAREANSNPKTLFYKDCSFAQTREANSNQKILFYKDCSLGQKPVSATKSEQIRVLKNKTNLKQNNTTKHPKQKQNKPKTTHTHTPYTVKKILKGSIGIACKAHKPFTVSVSVAAARQSACDLRPIEGAIGSRE